jgi:hypothetical protein
LAWNEEWLYEIDGVSINDHQSFFCMVPELDNMAEQDLILAPLAGDYPVFIRAQPREGRLTFNIAAGKGCTAVLWQTRLATLRTLFAQGVRHQLVVKARGMATTKSVYFYAEGMMTDYRTRIVSVRAIAPRPVLS